MTVAAEYTRQFRWRSWSQILAALPALDGQHVIDLGCAIGDQAAELVARGAQVVGVDANRDLLEVARSRGLVNAVFREGDLRSLDLDMQFDGIWSSFAAAYFPEMDVLPSWLRHLKGGGWIALVEVDDLFGHEPLSDEAKSRFGAYAADSLAAGRYDFHMGRKLASYLERAGLRVAVEMAVDDRELSFDGPADTDVLEAWDLRFARMKLLQDFCGPAFPNLRAEFLATLGRDDHRSRSRVVCCVAYK